MICYKIGSDTDCESERYREDRQTERRRRGPRPTARQLHELTDGHTTLNGLLGSSSPSEVRRVSPHSKFPQSPQVHRCFQLVPPGDASGDGPLISNFHGGPHASRITHGQFIPNKPFTGREWEHFSRLTHLWLQLFHLRRYYLCASLSQQAREERAQGLIQKPLTTSQCPEFDM